MTPQPTLLTPQFGEPVAFLSAAAAFPPVSGPVLESPSVGLADSLTQTSQTNGLTRTFPFEDGGTVSPGEISWNRTDYDLRLRARTLHAVSAAVVSHATGHPSILLTCEDCGSQPSVLSWCGVVLCLPCWRKQSARSFPEVVRVLTTYAKERRSSGLRQGVRFVTLTVRNGPDLGERSRVLLSAFSRLTARRAWGEWVEGSVAHLEVTWNPETDWHPHVHVLAGGRFIPDGPESARHSTDCRRPVTGECDRGCEPNLKDEWTAASDGEGTIVDVREASVLGDSLGFAAELVKYVTKPTASTWGGGALHLSDWPEDVRFALARWIRGGERVRWYCHVHQSASRRRCDGAEGACDGEYRREAVGLRRLRWAGAFRRIHREVEVEREVEDQSRRCLACGKGRMLTPREVEVRLALGWSLPAGAVAPPLTSMQAHSSADDPVAIVPQIEGPWSAGAWTVGPSAGSGPPLAEEWGARP